MTEQKFTEFLGKKMAGELTSQELIALNELLSKSDIHREEYEKIATYFNTEAPKANNIDTVFERIKEKINTPESETKVKPRLKINSRLWYQIAAVFAILICSFGAYRYVQSYEQNAKKRHADWEISKTQTREKSTLTLEDGTKVNLNAKSQLKYPTHFDEENREVYLTGEAFFDVKKNPEQPFIIHTSHMKIKVLGTAFDVKVYDNESSIETTLIRGLIEITLHNNPDKKILLKPNEKFTLTDKSTANYSISALTYYNAKDSSNNSILETSWLNDKFTFKNQKLFDIAQTAERRYGVEIRFKNELQKNYIFTGSYENESIDELLNSLRYIEKFNYKKTGNIIYIY